jgi:hypothetical protein
MNRLILLGETQKYCDSKNDFKPAFSTQDKQFASPLIGKVN